MALKWITLILAALMIAGVTGCATLRGAVAEANLQGPVVPTRNLPTPTPEATATAQPTAGPTPTATLAATVAATAEVTPEPVDPTAEATSDVWQIAGHTVTQPITVGVTARDTITTRQPLVFYGLRAGAEETLDIVMTSESGNLDPFLIVVDSAGREVARNDDLGLADTNAALRGLAIQPGEYLIVASRYGQRFGESVGDFSLSAERSTGGERSGTVAEAIAYDELREGTITNARSEYAYVFAAQAGDVISAQASVTSGNLDTAIMLTDHLGNPLARNDDDISSASTEAALRRVMIPADGHYSLIITRFQGPHGTSAGDFRLKLTLDAQNADEGGRLRYAVMNPLASGTIREDGGVYTDFFIGDQLDDDNVERTYQALLTFALPEAGADAAIERAEFIVGPCSTRGVGLSGSPLLVYVDTFDTANGTAAMAQISPGATRLARLSECATVDITAAVERLYARREPNIQLRLALDNPPQNGATDAVGLSEPRVAVLFEQPPDAPSDGD